MLFLFYLSLQHLSFMCVLKKMCRFASITFFLLYMYFILDVIFLCGVMPVCTNFVCFTCWCVSGVLYVYIKIHVVCFSL